MLLVDFYARVIQVLIFGIKLISKLVCITNLCLSRNEKRKRKKEKKKGHKMVPIRVFEENDEKGFTLSQLWQTTTLSTPYGRPSSNHPRYKLLLFWKKNIGLNKFIKPTHHQHDHFLRANPIIPQLRVESFPQHPYKNIIMSIAIYSLDRVDTHMRKDKFY